MGDGSVRFLNETIDYVTYNILGSRRTTTLQPANSENVS